MDIKMNERESLDIRVEEFECVGYYAHWEILAKGDNRIVYDRKAGRIITEYLIPRNNL